MTVPVDTEILKLRERAMSDPANSYGVALAARVRILARMRPPPTGSEVAEAETWHQSWLDAFCKAVGGVDAHP